MVVLIAVFGLGWLLDRIFLALDEGSQDVLEPYRLLGVNLTSSFTERQALEAAIGKWVLEPGASMLVMDRDQLALPESLSTALASGEPIVIESESGVTLYFSQANWPYVLAIVPPGELGQTLPVRLLLTVLFYVGIVLLMLLWLYPLLRRLHLLRAAARHFGEGRLTERVSTHQYSYLNDIESEFNRMASRIQGLVSDNKLLSNAVSHDLRTPLARLRFGVDALSEEDDAERATDYLARISTDLLEMEKLVEVLLNYARLDQGLSNPNTQIVSLSALVDERVRVFGQNTDRTLKWQLPGKDFPVAAHPSYVEMLLNNLLQNALAYSGQSVNVSIESDRTRTWVTVSDDGPGIPETERDSILKPFVRGGQGSPKGNPMGFGMGLAIVQRIAEWHDALLLIEHCEELGGAKFRVGFLNSRGK